MHLTPLLAVILALGACSAPDVDVEDQADRPAHASAEQAPLTGDIGDDAARTRSAEIAEITIDDESALAAALAAYLDISALLANDSVDGIAELGQSLVEALDAALTDAPPGVHRHAQALATAENVPEAREHFGELSAPLVDILRVSGVDTEGVYRFVCGMAEAPGGGIWLQRGSDPQNPYFGAMMLRCARESGAFESAVDPQA